MDEYSSLAQLSDEQFWHYARELAHNASAAQSAQPAQPTEYLQCVLSRGDCLIPLAALYEVVLPPHRFALLPAIPQWMIGVLAWRGETIAVIDLDAYLIGSSGNLLREGILLIASQAGLLVGLLVPSLGQTIPLQHEQEELHADTLTHAEQQPVPWYLPMRATVVKSVQAEAIVLDVPLLLADVVQQIETAASYG